jgi:hypothetical protein
MTSDDFERDDQLRQLARRLGEREAAGIDPMMMARRVQAGLAEPAPLPRVRWSRVWMPLAAAATLTLAVGIGVQVRGSGEGFDGPVVPADVAELDAEELEAVLDSLAVDVPVSELVTVGLYELTESELATLLETMEG